MKNTKKLWKDFLSCGNILSKYPQMKNITGSDFMKYNFSKEIISL